MASLSSDFSAQTTATRTPVVAEDRVRLPGVNVGGYLRTASGVGAAIRSYLRALRRLNVPVALWDVSELSGNQTEGRPVVAPKTDERYDINLVCGEVDLHFALMAQLGEEFFHNGYNIGVWFWELPQFPAKWYDRFVYYDEIWAASSFIANALTPISPIPVVRLPPILTIDTPGSRESGRRHLGVSPQEFVFLFIFDFHSRFQRKNPLAVIEAFRKAFAPTDPARLVIKCVNQDFDRANFAAMTARAEGYPILLPTGYWSGAEMRDLMAACDAYVSLHRSEGIGLTITDAMALGKPVIATGWSGNMDFMTVANSFPVRYDLVTINEKIGHFQAGETWAEPSVEHAAQAMRFVFENRSAAEARGQAAKRDLEANYSEAKIAKLVEARLNLIRGRHQFSALKRELQRRCPNLNTFLTGFRDISPYVPVKHLRYQEILARIRQTVQELLPSRATVLVVGKGDDELLKLGGCTSWHFPQMEDGTYAGHHPATSAEAIDHLETLRTKGAEYLLFPHTALWWLDHYGDFQQHLDRHYAVVARQEDTCVIYALCERKRL